MRRRRGQPGPKLSAEQELRTGEDPKVPKKRVRPRHIHGNSQESWVGSEELLKFFGSKTTRKRDDCAFAHPRSRREVAPSGDHRLVERERDGLQVRRGPLCDELRMDWSGEQTRPKLRKETFSSDHGQPNSRAESEDDDESPGGHSRTVHWRVGSSFSPVSAARAAMTRA
jgi:hypothetical protein